MTFHLRVNGRFTTQKVTGVQRYAIETSEALASLIAEEAALSINVVLVTPPHSHEKQKTRMRVRVAGCFGGHFWEQIFLPFVGRGVLFNLCNTFPVFCKKQIVVVHDASIYAVPKGYTRSFVLFYRIIFFFLRFKKCTRIVTDSIFSQKEISRYTGISTKRISVIYCGADHWDRVTPDLTVLARHALTGKKFLLAVSSANPNKNLERLVAAYISIKRPDLYLVLVGGVNNRIFSESNGDSAAGIIRTGYVTDPELAALYAAATGFLFPSLYEGFGLPPLEAMMFGCPVITSREASLPEVCGEAALYCNAREIDDIAKSISQLLDDENVRLRLVTAGHIQVQKFKWRNTARALLNIAQEIQ